MSACDFIAAMSNGRSAPFFCQPHGGFIMMVCGLISCGRVSLILCSMTSTSCIPDADSRATSATSGSASTSHTLSAPSK